MTKYDEKSGKDILAVSTVLNMLSLSSFSAKERANKDVGLDIEVDVPKERLSKIVDGKRKFTESEIDSSKTFYGQIKGRSGSRCFPADSTPRVIIDIKQIKVWLAYPSPVLLFLVDVENREHNVFFRLIDNSILLKTNQAQMTIKCEVQLTMENCWEVINILLNNIISNNEYNWSNFLEINDYRFTASYTKQFYEDIQDYFYELGHNRYFKLIIPSKNVSFEGFMNEIADILDINDDCRFKKTIDDEVYAEYSSLSEISEDFHEFIEDTKIEDYTPYEEMIVLLPLLDGESPPHDHPFPNFDGVFTILIENRINEDSGMKWWNYLGYKQINFDLKILIFNDLNDYSADTAKILISFLTSKNLNIRKRLADVYDNLSDIEKKSLFLNLVRKSDKKDLWEFYLNEYNIEH